MNEIDEEKLIPMIPDFSGDGGNGGDGCGCNLRFLNIERANDETLRTFNRADAAKAPLYWTPGTIVELKDGTFGILMERPHARATGGDILTMQFPVPNPAVEGFHLIEFGGEIDEGPSNQPRSSFKKISANMGTVTYVPGSNRVEFAVRIFEQQNYAKVWIRYGNNTSRERVVLPPRA